MNEIFLSPISLLKNNAVQDVIKCNNFTSKHGLTLSYEQAQELIETKHQSLKNTGRIEIEGGAINKIINAFHDSPHIDGANYASVLNSLVETFYYFKNETLEAISDDQLIDAMKAHFNESCGGSIELLQGRELELLTAKIKAGIVELLGGAY